MRLPGLIDIHVHLRDPGQTHKEDFYTGTSAALAGGVTTIFDMPNKSFHVLTKEELDIKMNIAKRKAVCDYGFYFGTDGENIHEFDKVADKVVGLKVYLNITTGHVLITAEKLEKVFLKWPKEKVIVVHTESDTIDLVLNFAARYRNRIHITHVNTKSLLEKIIAAKKDGLNITCDVTPHHLFLTKEDVVKLKGFGEVKPQLETKKDTEFLWEHISDIDCIASDHAPHTIEEKKSDNPPSGIPGLETMLPLLLTAVRDKRIRIEDIIRMTNTNPQKIFGFKQESSSYVEVDTDEKYVIEKDQFKTKCGWSPFEGWEVCGRIRSTFVRGKLAYKDGKILAKTGFGVNIISPS